MAHTMWRVIELLFGCWHHNLSRPFTLSGWTYEVCLNCGKKLAYDRADIGCVAQRGDPDQTLLRPPWELVSFLQSGAQGASDSSLATNSRSSNRRHL
jgi:hypothetical protein